VIQNPVHNIRIVTQLDPGSGHFLRIVTRTQSETRKSRSVPSQLPSLAWMADITGSDSTSSMAIRQNKMTQCELSMEQIVTISNLPTLHLALDQLAHLVAHIRKWRWIMLQEREIGWSKWIILYWIDLWFYRPGRFTPKPHDLHQYSLTITFPQITSWISGKGTKFPMRMERKIPFVNFP